MVGTARQQTRLNLVRITNSVLRQLPSSLSEVSYLHSRHKLKRMECPNAQSGTQHLIKSINKLKKESYGILEI